MRRLHLRTSALLVCLAARLAVAGPDAPAVEHAPPGASLGAAHALPLPFLAGSGAALVAPAERSGGAPPQLVHGAPGRVPGSRVAVVRAAVAPAAHSHAVRWAWYAVREHLLGTPPPHSTHAPA